MARVQARRKGAGTERVGDRLAAAFRRWEQAAEALDTSRESEEVQAVGMHPRQGRIAQHGTVVGPDCIQDYILRRAGKTRLTCAENTGHKRANFIFTSYPPASKQLNKITPADTVRFAELML